MFFFSCFVYLVGRLNSSRSDILTVFFKLKETISPTVKLWASLVIVVINVVYFCYALYRFGKEFWQDYKDHNDLERKMTQMKQHSVRAWSDEESGKGGKGGSNRFKQKSREIVAQRKEDGGSSKSKTKVVPIDSKVEMDNEQQRRLTKKNTEIKL